MKRKKEKIRWLKKGFKVANLWILALLLISSQAQVFSAFEAHVINVTATIQDNTPWAEPAGGEYEEAVEVSLFTNEPGATILYTTDGSNPACPGTGNLYINPILIETDTILKAVACGLRGSKSGMMTEIYTIGRTADISPIADAYLYQGSPNTNYGSYSDLKIRTKSNYNKRTFIRFDFYLPSGTTIDSSFLKLYMYYAPLVSRTYDTNRSLASWIEKGCGGITWNNQPAVADTPTTSIPSGTTLGWLSWDVTSDVQGFVAGTLNNYGWRLSDSAENSSISYEGKFYSREYSNSDLRPMLEVTFTPPEVTTNYPVINEVYYYVGTGKGSDPTNEWVEIYNPTNDPVDISGWKICDNSTCDTIPASDPIPAKGFAVITSATSTWDYWTVPDEAIKVVLGSSIGGGLSSSGDRVILKDASDSPIDGMSYGSDTSQLNPSVPLSGKGKSLARIIKGYDTNLAQDWIINATPNPGTNPSEDGVETISITSQGVEVVGSEPVPEEEEIYPLDEFVEEEDPVVEETTEEITTSSEEEIPSEEGTTTEEESATTTGEESTTEETTTSTDEAPVPDAYGVGTGQATSSEESTTTEEPNTPSEEGTTPSEEDNTSNEEGTTQDETTTGSESPTTENTETGTETPSSEENNSSNENSNTEQIDSAPPTAEESPVSVPSDDSGNSADASGSSDGSSSSDTGSGEGVGGSDGGSGDSGSSTADSGQSTE